MLKILLLAANPFDTPRLRLDVEFSAIDSVLQQAMYRDKFDLKQHSAVRISDLQGYLLRYQPHIVHFSSHGSISGEIILENNAGNSQPVPSDALSDLFSVLKGNIRCVVLNACYSDKQAQSIAQHIDYVVGMSRQISDKAAIDFVTAFYRAIANGMDLETSFDLGCNQIGLENLNEENTPKFRALNSDSGKIILAYDERKTKASSEEEEGILTYNLIFDRAAFRQPCIFEEGLLDLKDALDDSIAAIATGSLYSRNHNLLAHITPKSAFRSKHIRETLERVTDHLQVLRPSVIRLFELLKSLSQQYLGGEDIYVMEMFVANLIKAGAPHDSIRQVLMIMDEIDTKRNNVLMEINTLFATINAPTFSTLPLSTERIMKSAEPGMIYKWREFYIRTHDIIRPLLHQT